MADGGEVHVELPDPPAAAEGAGEVAASTVDAAIDHAETLGEHTARLGAVEAANEDLKGVAGALALRLEAVEGTAASTASAVSESLARIPETVAAAVAEALKGAQDAAGDVVEPPAPVRNEAEDHQPKGFWGRLTHLLNFH